MEISTHSSLRAQRVQDKEIAAGGIKPTAARGASSPLQVSDSARELNELARLVHNSSELRSDVVAPLKQQIESGSYRVDLEKLAERLADEF